MDPSRPVICSKLRYRQSSRWSTGIDTKAFVAGLCPFERLLLDEPQKLGWWSWLSNEGAGVAFRPKGTSHQNGQGVESLPDIFGHMFSCARPPTTNSSEAVGLVLSSNCRHQHEPNFTTKRKSNQYVSDGLWFLSTNDISIVILTIVFLPLAVVQQCPSASQRKNLHFVAVRVPTIIFALRITCCPSKKV